MAGSTRVTIDMRATSRIRREPNSPVRLDSSYQEGGMPLDQGNVGMPEEDKIAVLREYAARAREVARVISNQEAAHGLLRYAEQQEAKANELEAIPVLPP